MPPSKEQLERLKELNDDLDKTLAEIGFTRDEFRARLNSDPNYLAAMERIDKHHSRPEVKGEFSRLKRQREKKGTTLNIFSLMLQWHALEHPTLTEQLKFLIKSQGWSLTALGELAGIAPSVLSRFMSGKTTLTLETVDRLFQSLRLEILADDGVLQEMAIVKDRRKKKAPGKEPEGGNS